MNAAAPATPPKWIVTYDGGFWNNEGNAGFEVTIGKTFYWGREKWYVPAVYICDKGLIVDFFMEADPSQVKAFIDKWDLFNEYRNHYTKEQREQIQREHPLNVSFHSHITFNGQELQSNHGCGLTWLPDFCQNETPYHDPEAKYVLEHYGLDMNQAWSINRWSYRWGNTNGLDVQSITVRMERQRENIAGQHFVTPAVGESISITHPLTGQTHALTVHEVEHQELPEGAFRDPSMEYPSHFTAMSYSLEPDITGRGFMIQDYAEGDRPRQKKHDTNAFEPVAFSATAVGVIGAADGPTAIIMGQNTPMLHAACSSLHFEPVDDVEWRVIFSEKLMDDIEVELV